MGLSFAAQAHTPVRWYFNPRAPCGARLLPLVAIWYIVTISIHAPLAGATAICVVDTVRLIISIHAPLAGRDIITSTPEVAT